jgi:hypothetical protein
MSDNSVGSVGSAFGVRFAPAQLGLCLGGLLTTWSVDDPKPHLWAVEQPGLPDLMYQGKISKVARSADVPNRFREAGEVDETNSILRVQVEGESEPRSFVLGPPRDVDARTTWFDLGRALSRAIRYTTDTPGRVLVLERGGLQAPHLPFALVTLQGGELIVEARPAPVGSTPWSHYLKDDSESGLLSTPISDQGLRSAGLMMMEAARTWGVTPWDLALTYSA